MLRTIALVVLVLAGCKDKDKTEKSVEPPKTEPATREPVITPPPGKSAIILGGAASLIGEDGAQRKELAIDATGKVTEDGKQVAEVTREGELKVDGKVVSTIAWDGKVTILGEPDEQMTIREDGSMTDRNGKVMLEIAEDGTIGGPIISEMKAGAKLRVTGDKAARRGLMFAFFGVETKH